jgi:WASH complex subunit 7
MKRILTLRFIELLGEQLLGKLTDFVSKYGNQLHEIETSLDETLSEVWDAMEDPVGLNAQPYEQTTVLQLVRTDNKLFNKVTLIFASLCLEMKHLTEHVSNELPVKHN